jgi:hypothetical protein
MGPDRAVLRRPGFRLHTNLATATTTIDVDAGETVTCNFTNRARRGIIRIVTDAVPDAKRDFLFTEVGVPDFVLDDDGTFRNPSPTPRERTFANLTTGVYHVRETAPGGGYYLTGLTCDDPMVAVLFPFRTAGRSSTWIRVRRSCAHSPIR